MDARRRLAARSPAGVRLHAGGSVDLLMTPMAVNGAEAIGSMGTDTPISARPRTVEAALHLFPAELRPGDEPADRSDPRGALVMSLVSDSSGRGRTSARPQGQLEAQAPRSASADPDQRRPREDPLDRTTFEDYEFRYQDARHHLRLDRAVPTGMAAALERLCSRAEPGGDRAATTSSSCPIGLVGPGSHPDPGAARDRRRASPSDPRRDCALPVGSGRGDRRGARGPSFRDCLAGYGARPSTPISPSRRLADMGRQDVPRSR